MSNLPYPLGIDCVWIASDKSGCIAAFATGGTGPIPLLAIESTAIPLAQIEERICGLSGSTTARLLVEVPRPDSFIELAARGLFVYDWSDAHRTTSMATGCYEAMAVPETPITVDSLPNDLARFVKEIRFGEVKFIDVLTIDVRLYAKCSDGEQ